MYTTGALQLEEAAAEAIIAERMAPPPSEPPLPPPLAAPPLHWRCQPNATAATNATAASDASGNASATANVTHATNNTTNATNASSLQGAEEANVECLSAPLPPPVPPPLPPSQPPATGLAKLTEAERSQLLGELEAALNTAVTQVNGVEAARLAANSALGRGRYTPLSSVGVAYDPAQNAFTYSVAGACELGHRMVNATDAAATWLAAHGLLEATPHACTIIEHGAPDPPPASPPPPSPKPPPLTPPLTVMIETSVQFGLNSVSGLASSRRRLQEYDVIGGATSAFAASILEWGRERRAQMDLDDLEGMLFSTRPEVHASPTAHNLATHLPHARI